MASTKKIVRGPAGRPYQIGDLYSFHTSPANEFSPPETGRFAALKVIGFKNDSVCIAVLDAIFDRHPSLRELKDLPIIRQMRFTFGGKQACCFVFQADCETLLQDVRYVGNGGISQVEASLCAGCQSHSVWSWANPVAEGEWRWKHDRSVYEEEVRRKKEAFMARLAAERDRREMRLKALTWQTFLREKPLARWDRRPPFPPSEFVDAARAQIHSTARALEALGSKPTRPQVRAILKSCVDWFNAKDREFGGVIETEERDDICAVLEELAFMARQSALTSEIDNWRDW